MRFLVRIGMVAAVVAAVAFGLGGDELAAWAGLDGWSRPQLVGFGFAIAVGLAALGIVLGPGKVRYLAVRHEGGRSRLPNGKDLAKAKRKVKRRVRASAAARVRAVAAAERRCGPRARR